MRSAHCWGKTVVFIPVVLNTLSKLCKNTEFCEVAGLVSSEFAVATLGIRAELIPSPEII